MENVAKVFDRQGVLVGYKALNRAGELLLRQASYRAAINDALPFSDAEQIAIDNYNNYKVFLHSQLA